MSRALYVLLPLTGGAFIAAQAPINARLRLVLGSPVGSAFISFLVGTVLLLVALLAVRDGGDVLSGIGGGPWWAYLGGALGAFFVISSLLAAPRVGVTATFVAVVAGQVAMAALIDRFGWLGQEAIPLHPERIAALALLAVSLVLLTWRA